MNRSFLSLYHFLSLLPVCRVNLPVCKHRDHNGGGTAEYYDPEEVDVTDCFLKITCKHARNHHAQCHEGGADGVVRRLEFPFGKVHHVEHIGRESESVAELLDGNGR